MTRQFTLSRSAGAWIEALRPKTLPLALASILLGSFLAAADQSFRWPIAVLCALTAVFLQILSNLANDYGDAMHGADHVERVGPQRAVQSGLISASAMKRGMALVVLLSILSGTAVVWLAFGSRAVLALALFLLLGAAAIAAAITYTAGKMPYGYVGLGDVFVLIFFGWVGVLGTYFLQTLRLDWVLFLPATSCGLLAVAVLNVNNIRDIESDRKAGKRTIPVRLGRTRARRYHWVLLGTAVSLVLIYVLFNFDHAGQFLFFLSVPLLWKNGTAVSRINVPQQLNPWLKQMSLSTLAFVVTFGIGQLL